MFCFINVFINLDFWRIVLTVAKFKFCRKIEVFLVNYFLAIFILFILLNARICTGRLTKDKYIYLTNSWKP